MMRIPNRSRLGKPRRRHQFRGAAREFSLRGVERCEDRLLLTFHLWKMDQVFSSADGKVQFIELHDPSDGESHLAGHSISSNENTFTFPANLPSDATANHHFLIGTTDYAKQPGAVAPDYTVPDNFFSTSGDTFNYADVDSFSFTAGQLPTDGVNAMFRDVNSGALTTGANLETNFAGQSGSVTVSASPTGAGVTFAATEGAAFSGTAATISESGAVASNFSTTINWGDGASSAGNVVNDPKGGFDVVGNHTYAEEVTAAVQVTVTDSANHTITVNSQANVADASLSATGVPISLASGLTLNNVPAATFTDAGGAEAATNYSATIDWGDGSSTTTGTVSAGGNTFSVTGSHTYASDVARTVTVTITDEGGSKATAITIAQSGYLQLNLVADRSGFAMIQDPSLVNPWGIGLSPSGPFWISDNGTNESTLYGGDAAGSPLGKIPLTVSIPGGAPTGQVFNATSDFVIGTGANAGPAAFIFDSANGDITAWGGKLSPITQALNEWTTPGAVYKGLTMASDAGANYLYAADFHDDRIDVFDKGFQPVTLGAGPFTGTFSDPNIPAGYAPFNIENLGGRLYVTYAQQDAAKQNDVAGFGHGFVDIYDTAGNLVKELIVGQPGQPSSPLNSPWGLALAPAGFGDFASDLLVGNFGNGWINAFDPNTGAFLGSFSDPSGNPIVIDGLWDLTFGNGGKGGDVNTLFFTAGSNGQADGLFGSLQSAVNTPLAGEGATFAATEGASFRGNVATVNDVAAGALPANFTATINWGDGSSSPGTVVTDLSGGFNVTGSHMYSEEGSDAVKVTVADAASHTITIAAQGDVADATLAGTGLPITLTQGVQVNSAALATFTDAGGAEPAADYTATVDWGDGTSATAGTITAAGGTFTVAGNHTYAAVGAHTIAITITDDGGATLNLTTSTGSGYLQLNLVSDLPGTALIQDPSLVNPWGLAFSAAGPFWVADNGANVATIYSGGANSSPLGKAGLTVSIPGGAPSGQVFNGTSDFLIGSGANSIPAAFIFATENGDIVAWNGKLSQITQALTEWTTPGAVYKGLAIGANGTANFLYATDFRDDRIDVFDKSFQPVTLGAGAFTGTFSDPDIPAGFAPFGIEDLGGKLYVTYAKQDAGKHDDVAGFGNGFVDVFDTAGNVVQRLIVGSPGSQSSPLNSPWGLAMAPVNFGDFSNDLLVGNFGDGKINAFDPANGAFLGTMSSTAGAPIVMPGLWSLAFGNGGNAGNTDTLFFTAGTNGGSGGTFGALETAQNNPLVGIGGKLTGTEGLTLTGTLATIADVAGGAHPGDFNATIAWGDGSSSTGTVAGNGSGGFLVTGSHTFEAAGADSVQVFLTDAASHTVTLNASVTIVNPPAPTANPDTFVLGSGSSTSAGSGQTSVLSNDTSADAQPQRLVATKVADVTHGSLTLNSDGSFTYTPNATFQGIDRFTYQIGEGPTPGNTVTVTLLSYHASLVDKLYNQVLHRSAEDAGLTFWTGLLDQGNPLDVVAAGIFNSTERLDPLVTQFYQQFLGRGTDPAGLAFWVADWQTRGDPRDVVENILASQEFFNDAGDTNAGYVTLLYERVLQRPPETAGFNFWVSLMSNPPTNPPETRRQIASQFYDTHEKHVDLVDFLFSEYFNAVSPLPSTAPYVAALDAGQTETQVEKAIIDSPEYSNNPAAPAAGAVGRALYPH
jgi:uncharacterized protein (TIGR03118 family)